MPINTPRLKIVGEAEQLPRPEPTCAIDSVMDQLWDLMERIECHSGDPKHRGNNMLKKYQFFLKHGPEKKGRACPLSMKCKQLFLLSDYQEVRAAVLKLVETYRMVEGDEDFAK